MADPKEEKQETIFMALGGAHQEFINSLAKLRAENTIVNQWISTQIISVSQADYNQMANQLKASPELIAQIPKAQTVFMCSGLFEVIPNKKIIKP